MNPAFGAFNRAHLDSCKGFIKFLCNGAHFVHSARETDLVAVVNDLAYRTDNCRRAAETALGKILNLFKRNLSGLNLPSEHMLGNIAE